MTDEAPKPKAPELPTLTLKPKADKPGAKARPKPMAKGGAKRDTAKPKDKPKAKSAKQAKPDTQSMLKSRQICYEIL